jgi:actin-related protein 10
MSTVPATPRARATAAPSTPATNRLNTSAIHQSSPHYATTRRHSLYGTEDRVVIDPGSRIWKIGFSGEGRPRDVFYVADDVQREADDGAGGALWTLDRAGNADERDEQEKLLEAKLQARLRAVFHE